LVSIARNLSTVHQIKQFIAVQQVDARLLPGLPTLQPEIESTAGRLMEGLAQQIINHILKSASLGRSSFFDLTQQSIVNHQSATHASK
jgi:hypothetical protein